MDRKGFELSLNMIIVVILALVFLGVAISFIYKIVLTPPEIPAKCDIYPPTAGSPVCVNQEYDIKRGQTVKMKVSFYNDEDADIASSTLPVIMCGTNTAGQPLELTSSSTGTDVSVGESADYLVLVTIPKDAFRSTYPCNLRLSNTEESFAIVVT